VQRRSGTLLAPGARNYWKSHDFVDLHDDTIGAAVDPVRRPASARSSSRMSAAR